MSVVKRYYVSPRTMEFMQRADPNSEIPPDFIGLVAAPDYDALQQRCNAQADVILSASHALGLPVDAGAESVCEAITDLQRKCAERHKAILRLETERDALRAEIERLRNPTDDMLVAGQEVWTRGRIGALEDCEEARAIYLAMVDEAGEATP